MCSRRSRTPASWFFAWYAFVDEQIEHGQWPEARAFVIQTTRDTLENWQAEFLQLVWQVSGSHCCITLGRHSRKRATRIDLILQALDKDGKKEIAKLDRTYFRD
jgi:hypothetical protein